QLGSGLAGGEAGRDEALVLAAGVAARGAGVWPAVSAAGAVALAALVAGGVRAGLPGRRTASGQARDQSPYRC
ncbi:hypothetical protein ABT357_16965, partial [Streptomyces albidoflavus]